MSHDVKTPEGRAEICGEIEAFKEPDGMTPLELVWPDVMLAMCDEIDRLTGGAA